MDDRNRPRNCADWQKILVGIANGIEPMDPYIGTMARMHAVRCDACREFHFHATVEAHHRGIMPVSTIIPLRVLVDREARAAGSPSDPTAS